MTAASTPKFKAVRHLGRGASAEVYLIRNPETGEERVLKRIALATRKSWPRERAEQELAVLRRLQHPNVVELLGVDLREGFLEVHYPFYPGRTLTEHMEARGPLAPAAFLPILRDVLAGLAYLHDQDLVHRDLKPDNVYLTKAGRAILLDLGLVKDLGSSEDLTATGEIVGTPAYSSPETFTTGRTSPAMDLYSTALVSFRALTGEMPYGKPKGIREAVEQHLSAPMPHLAEAGVDAPAALDELIQQMARKTADERPSAEAALQVVTRLVGEAGPPPASHADAVTVGRPRASREMQPAPVPARPSPPASAPGAGPGSGPGSAEPAPGPARRAAPVAALLAGMGLAGLALGPRGAAPAGAPRPAASTAQAEAAPPATPPAQLPVIQDLRKLVDGWTTPGQPDPADDFRVLHDAPALEALRRSWRDLATPDRPAFGEAVQQVSDEGRAVGFPPLLVPFQWPVAPEGAGARDGDLPLRFLTAAARYGGVVPPDLRLPGAAAAGLAVDRAVDLGETVEETLRRESRRVLGSSGALTLFSTVVRSQTRGALWYVLTFATDEKARRGLYELYEPLLREALRALRHLVVVSARAPDGPAPVLAEAWLRAEIMTLRPALMMALYFVPVEDLLEGLPAGRREVAACHLYTMASRLARAASRPGEVAAMTQAHRAAEAAAARAPAPPSVARVRAALDLEARLRAALRPGSKQPAVEVLEGSAASWDQLAPWTLQEILTGCVVSMKAGVERLPRPLAERILAIVEAVGTKPPPAGREAARKLLREALG